MKYTRVRRAVSAVMIDSYDEDRNPELVKVNGTVTFTPLLKDGDVVQWAGPNGPQSLVLAPIECFISNGIIMHRGGEGIFLAAGGPGVQPDVIQWKATFSNMQAGGWAFNLKPVMFDAVPDGEVDLTLVSPIAGASEPIVRGPAGVGLKSITVDGSELVVTVTSEAGTYVMSRIPLEDVVRAEADQAVASVQAAIKADVDAAASSASAAKSSEDAAAASATDAQNAASQTVASAQAAIKADVDAAAASASSAQASAATATTQAETAATQAGTAMEQANAAATSATDAESSAANAKASETSAGESAATATNEADRAKTEADRAAQKATEVANTVEGNFSPIGHHHVWSEIDDKPTVFPPSEHTHTTAQVTGLQSALDGKAAKSHRHVWTEIDDKPSSFPPDEHTHPWTEIDDKPATFPPDEHTHALAEVTGLQSALDGKADKSHTHTTEQVTGLDARLTGIDSAVAGKASAADMVAEQQKPRVWPVTGNLGAEPTWPAGSRTGDLLLNTDTLELWQTGAGLIAQLARTAPQQLGVADFNTLTTSGVWVQDQNVDAQNSQNNPVKEAGLLEVYSYSAMVWQRFTKFENPDMYVRAQYLGSWSAWRKITTT